MVHLQNKSQLHILELSIKTLRKLITTKCGLFNKTNCYDGFRKISKKQATELSIELFGRLEAYNNTLDVLNEYSDIKVDYPICTEGGLHRYLTYYDNNYSANVEVLDEWDLYYSSILSQFDENN